MENQIEESYLYKINKFTLYKLEQIKESISKYKIDNYPITTILLNFIAFTNLINVFVNDLSNNYNLSHNYLYFYKILSLYSILIPIFPYINMDSKTIFVTTLVSTKFNINFFENILLLFQGYIYAYVAEYIYNKIPNGTFKIILSYLVILTFIPIFPLIFGFICPIVLLVFFRLYNFIENSLFTNNRFKRFIYILVIQLIISPIGHTFMALYINKLIENNEELLLYEPKLSMKINYIINDLLHYFIITGIFYYLM